MNLLYTFGAQGTEAKKLILDQSLRNIGDPENFMGAKAIVSVPFY